MRNDDDVFILFSVANRKITTLSLDPLNPDAPALSLDLPLFVFVFAALLLGMLLGGFLVWMSQGKHRRALRQKSHEAEKLKQETKDTARQANTDQVEIAPGLPLVSRN